MKSKYLSPSCLALGFAPESILCLSPKLRGNYNGFGSEFDMGGGYSGGGNYNGFGSETDM